MPKKIPIKTAKQFAKDNKCTQVIIFAWDGKLQHVVTYGDTVEDCDQAAQGADKLKKILGWKGDKKVYPNRVKKLKKILNLIKSAFKDAMEIYEDDENEGLSYMESLLSVQKIELRD